MRKLIGIIMISALVLSACQEAPKGNDDNKDSVSVTEGAEKPASTKPAKAPEKDSSVMLVSLDEARSQVASLLGSSYEGFSFPDYIVMTDADSVSDYSVEVYHNDDLAAVGEYLSKIWDDFVLVDRDKAEVSEYTNASIPGYYAETVFGEDYKYIYTTANDGMMCGNSLDSSWGNYSGVNESYEFEWGDVADDAVYELSDGSYSVTDAVKLVEDRCNEVLSEMEGDFTYKVQHLYVTDNSETATPDYKMIVGRCVNGIPLDTCEEFYTFEDTDYDKVFRGDGLTAIVHRKDKIDCFNTAKPLLKLNKENDHSEIVSPFYAIDRMKNEIASIGAGSFDYCGLVYLMEQERRENDKGEFYAFEYETSVKSYMKPFWVFMKKDPEAYGRNGNCNYYQNIVIVDALDASVYYFDATS